MLSKDRELKNCVTDPNSEPQDPSGGTGGGSDEPRAKPQPGRPPGEPEKKAPPVHAKLEWLVHPGVSKPPCSWQHALLLLRPLPQR